MNELEHKPSEWWEQHAKDVGVERAWKDAQGLRAKGGAAAEVGVNNYLKMLDISRPEREVETLKLARRAWWASLAAIGIAAATAVGTIALAFQAP